MRAVSTTLENKVAIVSGAASGIGSGIAELFVESGCCVVIADIDEAAGSELASRLGHLAHYLPLDVKDESSWTNVFDLAKKNWGDIDILVNNAGIGSAESIEDVSMDVWHEIIAINTTGVFLGCRTAIQSMKESGVGGSIINISSALGLKPLSSTPAYGASKAAVVNLTKSTALHCAESGYNIRCNAINPGFIRTPLLDKALDVARDPDGMLQGYRDLHPLGCIGDIQDVARAALFLAGNDAKFVTGISLPVDGGMTI